MATVVAGLSILVTGRYPRGLFDFNVGVLRWTWRVGHYSYLTLGTDAYPFTLRATDHPAALELSYPERLSRGFVLVKWLLVVPHLLVVGILVGTSLGVGDAPAVPLLTGGLIGLLVLVAGVHLALLRRYPRELFDLLVGLNRWVFRVIAYLALLTDIYPPFRLDLGGMERDSATATGQDGRALVSSGAR